MKCTLEDIMNKTKQAGSRAIQSASHKYDLAYAKYPLITNYVSSAVGTVGGDFIAKKFTENPEYTLRDLTFTALAASAYSYLAPKMIEWSTKLTDKISRYKKEIKEDKLLHNIYNTIVLTTLYMPVNMVYWNYLTIKNEAQITLESNLLGLATLCLASVPYLVADYIAITKFSKPDGKKYLRPFYSGVEILWNTMFAGGNYIAKRT